MLWISAILSILLLKEEPSLNSFAATPNLAKNNFNFAPRFQARISRFFWLQKSSGFVFLSFLKGSLSSFYLNWQSFGIQSRPGRDKSRRGWAVFMVNGYKTILVQKRIWNQIVLQSIQAVLSIFDFQVLRNISAKGEPEQLLLWQIFFWMGALQDSSVCHRQAASKPHYERDRMNAKTCVFPICPMNNPKPAWFRIKPFSLPEKHQEGSAFSLLPSSQSFEGIFFILYLSLPPISPGIRWICQTIVSHCWPLSGAQKKVFFERRMFAQGCLCRFLI